MNLDKQTLLEAAEIIEHRGVCAVTMINADERLAEKKAYAWDALQHAIELRALAVQQPESSRGASKQEEPNEPINTLLRFYGVLTLSALVLAQSHHIERLQSKLPLLKDERPGYVPREG